MGLTKNQQDLVNISLTVLQNRFGGNDGLYSSGAEKHINVVLRSVAALIDRSTAADIEAARRELQEMCSPRTPRNIQWEDIERS